jgi:hypothetical protein
MKTRLTACRFSLLVFVVLGRVQAADLYVSTQGNDSNPGTAAQPLRTITRAYSLAGAGTTIIVMPGVYTDYSTGWGLHLNKSGTASNPIVLRSQSRGRAVIDGQTASDRNKAVYLDGSYHVIDGFEITGGPNAGITVYGNCNQILNNDIHHNGTVDGPGQVGVYSDKTTHHNIYRGNYIHDNGRASANLDHGMYLCGDSEMVINNVIVRNTTYGLQIAGYNTVSTMKVYNNVIAHNGKSGIILWMSLSGVDIKNNIIYRNAGYGITSWEAHGSGVVFDKNLLFGNGTGSYNFVNGGSDYTYTLGTTVAAEPGVVNSTRAGFDPHLAVGSPAIGTGVNLSTVFSTDKDGAARPATGAWDLGAYVYTSLSPSAARITTQPADQTVAVGQTTNFSVAASGTAPLSYQWQKNGANIPGATASSYTTPATTIFDNSSTFRCVVTNSAGSATSSNALLTVLTASTKFTNGQQVVSTATINVHSPPAGALLGTQPSGAIGTVIDGPVFAAVAGQNVWWWNIAFPSGASGWVREDLLNAYEPPAPVTYYVSISGSDSNRGTATEPFRTISYAYNNYAGPGVTIVVMAGTYTDYQGDWGLRVNKSGTASSPIIIKSQVRGQATIDGQNAADRNRGIYLDGSYNVIDGFEVKGAPNTGIGIWGNYNQIINNRIHHNGTIEGPGQVGIYSDKTTHHNVYQANHIHDNGRPGSNLDHGMYLCGDDEMVINNVIVGNATHGVQISGYSTVRNMKVYNNVMAYNGRSGIMLWTNLSGVDIKNNVLYRNGTYGIGSWGAHGSGVIIDNNLSFSNGSGDYNLTTGGSDFTYTLGSTISADPLFVSSSLAGFDAHLAAGSPATDAGVNLSTVFNIDKDGVLRPAAGAWDVGAYEFGPLIPRPARPEGLRLVADQP